MAQQNEGAVFVTDEQRERLLRGVFDLFYEGGGGVIFDTSRSWTTKLAALSLIVPAAKMVCCVRDLGWIVDSFERLYQRNPFEPSGIYGFRTGTTVYSRAEMVSGRDGVTGHAFEGLKEAYFGPHRDRILLVEYEDLCKAPKRALARIYEFLGEQTFDHDFAHVEYDASEFDRKLGARGLHDVSGAVEWRPRKSILPPDLFARYANDQFWRA